MGAAAAGFRARDEFRENFWDVQIFCKPARELLLTDPFW